MILVDVLSSTILLRERWSRYSNQETLHPVSRIVLLGYAVAIHVKFNFRSLFVFFFLRAIRLPSQRDNFSCHERYYYLFVYANV